MSDTTETEDLLELSKNDLYSKALEYGFEGPYQTSTKKDLVAAIEAAQDDAAGDEDDEGTDTTPDEQDAADATTERSEGNDDDDNIPADKDGRVLLRYNGNATTYQIKGLTVGRGRPFVVASKEVADDVLSGPARKQFSTATPSEAKEFYS